MLKEMQNKKGFTLVELIIVIAILAIIMLIAIPNFSGIQQRMQVRADKATAAQIGKAVRVWFTDYTTDQALAKSAAAGEYIPVAVTGSVGTALEKGTYVKYDGLAGIEGYISKGQKPSSLKVSAGGAAEKYQLYAVTLSEDASSANAKIKVAICKGTSSDNGATVTLAQPTGTGDYNGSEPAVAYIEP